jgi:quercetin dioxygenase-like cupin family protein
MNKIAFVLSLALTATAGIAGANAGTGKATALMVKALPDLPGKDGMVEVVDFTPGEVSQPHRHNADLFVYVLEGSIVTQVEGEAPKNLKAGDVFYESPTDVHVVSRNASATEPAKLLVFYVKDKGSPPTTLVQHDHK